MKIPNPTKIGPHLFEVLFVDVVNKDIPRRGEVDPQNNTIRLDKTMNKSKIEETWFHEVIHEIDYSLDLGLGEEGVGRLAYAVYMVLKDNGIVGDDDA